MTGEPQVAMQKASQIWQIFFPSQTLHVFYFSFTKPSDFWFGPSQKGTIYSSGFRNGKTRSNVFCFGYGERWRDKKFGTVHAINPDVKHVFKLSKSSNGSSKCPLLSFFRQQSKPF
jgi:hypothetical protein